MGISFSKINRITIGSRNATLNPSSQILTDGTQEWRIIAEDGELKWQYAMTALGFDGTESTDGVTGDYYTPESIPIGDFAFIFELTTTSPNETVVMPHRATANVDYIINYGDGSGAKKVQVYNSVNASHSYSDIGTYTVKIEGICNSFESFEGDANIPLTLTKIVSWGRVGLTYLTLSGCNLITEIPNDNYGGLKDVLSFGGTFTGLGILSIPSRLFRYVGNVSNFQSCFDGCANITEVPEGLMDYCTSAVNVKIMFDDCASLQTIHASLFANCPLIDSIYFTFKATALTNIPDGLLDNCPLIINAMGAFENTDIVSIPANLFAHQTMTNLYNTFKNCTQITGDVPALWLTYPAMALPQSFNGCINASNYASIPANWK